MHWIICYQYLTSQDDAIGQQTREGIVYVPNIYESPIYYSTLSLERAAEIFLMFNYSIHNIILWMVDMYIMSRVIFLCRPSMKSSEWKCAQQGNTGNEESITSCESAIAAAGSAEQKAKLLMIT